jgi:SpoVK/Ycf46/Vps4 family AAA+-type ATPase
MERLKEWLTLRADCYTEEAANFGIEPPKGLVLVGIPGSGKSLAAKASASCLGVPLLRLDMGRVFGKYMGESESRLRDTLRLVERMAPCVLFVDEVDKGLGGISGGEGGDGGTSKRVLGTYLTWLQELTAPVFNIVTANRVNGLPAELLRRGRFDQVFSVVYPNAAERREVLSIHLRKRGHDIDSLDGARVEEFISMSVNYSPAEIESAVKDALILAYSSAQSLTANHLIDAIRDIIPLYKSAESQIASILSWAEQNAVPVSRPPSKSPPARVRQVGRGLAPSRATRT